MNIEFWKEFLLWAFGINFGIMIFWFAAVTLAGDLVRKIQSSLFKINKEQYNLVMYQAFAFYKMTTYILFFVPLIVLHILDK